MRRRFLTLLVTAFSVGLLVMAGVGRASARPDDPPPSTPEPENPLPPAIVRSTSSKDEPAAPAGEAANAKDKAKPKSSDPKTKAEAKPKAKTKSADGWNASEPVPDEPTPISALPDLLPARPALAVPDPSELDGPGPPLSPVPVLEDNPRDAELQKVQAPATTPSPLEKDPLPPATARPKAAGAPAVPVEEGDAKFLPDPERLPLGPQTFGLTVNVLSPQTMNLNKPAVLKIVVKNNGPTEALGVVVRDVLPAGMKYESSQPEAKRLDSILSWSLGSISAGGDRTIVLNVTPTQVGSFDHAATVTMIGGGRSTTVVREPKLKVILTSSTSKLLKGKSVRFQIAVSNPGDGPARNVLVKGKLSPGLRHDTGSTDDHNVEQMIELLQPNERIELEVLDVDSTAGGEQSCTVQALSPDVVTGPDSKMVQTVTVVEPKLTLAISGPDKRYADTEGTYEIKLQNPGTAPARNVRILSTLPTSAYLIKASPGAKFDKQSRRLLWTRPGLEPGETATLTFQVKLGGIGLYQYTAEARGEGPLFEKGTFSTNVQGLADIHLDVTATRPVVDVGDFVVYKILITNKGTKEATSIKVQAKLAPSVEPDKIGGTELPGQFDPDKRLCLFPLIERIGPGQQTELQIRVKAVAAGPAICNIELHHAGEDGADEKVEDYGHFKITDTKK